MSNFLQDLRYGLRLMRRSPGFAAAAVVTLALGIGANTALFSVVSGILLRPLPYPQPDRLMSLWISDSNYPGRRPLGNADFNDWRAGTKAFEAAAAYTDNYFTLTGLGEPEKMRGAAVTPEFFQAMGVRPILGSGFASGDDAPGAPRRVVISHQLWERRYASSKTLVGQTIQVNGVARLVAGVMPAGFEFPTQDAQSLRGSVQIWSLMVNEPPQGGGRGPYYLWVVGRLKEGVTPEQGAAEANQIGAQVAREHPLENAKCTYTAAPLKESMIGNVRHALLLLQGAVAFVLLIAAANVANLLLARSAAREREIAVRTALGAGRGRIMRQLLTEGLLLAALGGAGGLLLARWGTDWLVRMSPESLPRLQEVGIDGRVLIFTGLTALACGLLVSMAPGLRTLRSDLNAALKQGARTGEDRASQRTWSAFVIAEVALAAMLLVGAALMLTSFIRLQSTSPGFEPAKIRTASVELSARYDTDPKINAFYDRMLEAVRGLPGVEVAGTGTSLPPAQLTVSDNFTIPGTELAAPPLAAWLAVSPDYFRALGVPILRGRDFTPADRAGTAWVTIINETLARRYFKDVDPIGKHIKIGGPERPKAPVLEIVGVAADVQFVGLGSEPMPAYYEPAAQVAWGSTYLVVRAHGDGKALTSALRATFKSLDPDMPPPVVRTMNENIAESVAAPRFRTLLLSIFGGAGLLLAAIGVYGVISYSVLRRTREIGVRMALGARPGDILRSVVRRGLLLTGVGLALGMGGALALSRLLSGLLFGVTSTDPRIYAAACLFFLAISLLACYLPARRAARVDPLVSLRCD